MEETDLTAELMEELQNLREENKILRDSLTETRPPETAGEGEGAGRLLQDLGGKFCAAAGEVKNQLAPGAEKLSENLSRQLAENPVPVLLAAFGAGYLFSRWLERPRRQAGQ